MILKPLIATVDVYMYTCSI